MTWIDFILIVIVGSLLVWNINKLISRRTHGGCGNCSHTSNIFEQYKKDYKKKQLAFVAVFL